jgi:hypothetical protein
MMFDVNTNVRLKYGNLEWEDPDGLFRFVTIDCYGRWARDFFNDETLAAALTVNGGVGGTWHPGTRLHHYFEKCPITEPKFKVRYIDKNDSLADDLILAGMVEPKNAFNKLPGYPTDRMFLQLYPLETIMLAVRGMTGFKGSDIPLELGYVGEGKPKFYKGRFPKDTATTPFDFKVTPLDKQKKSEICNRKMRPAHLKYNNNGGLEIRMLGDKSCDWIYWRFVRWTIDPRPSKLELKISEADNGYHDALVKVGGWFNTKQSVIQAVPGIERGAYQASYDKSSGTYTIYLNRWIGQF